MADSSSVDIAIYLFIYLLHTLLGQKPICCLLPCYLDLSQLSRYLAVEP